MFDEKKRKTTLVFDSKTIRKTMNRNGILLVQPDFPVPNKSINHQDYFPIGLLKIGSHYKYVENKNVKLVFGKESRELIINEIGYPEKILVTSLFTYWADYCYDAIDYYLTLFPKSEFDFGGIYVSLMTNKIRRKLKKKYPNKTIRLHTKLYSKAEKANLEYGPDLDLLNNHTKIDYLVVHSMRGCIRKCSFCGTWKIEKKYDWPADKFLSYVKMVKSKFPTIKKLVFYDNNLLANENIKDILLGLIELKKTRKIRHCESQSGFDGRLLNLKYARLLKKAGFIHPKIAWDNRYIDRNHIKHQIDILVKAVYLKKEISVFMLYNWEIKFEEMLEKVKACYNWGVQINDCRFRPLNKDDIGGYKPQKIYGQSRDEYYIHLKWEDWQVRIFRKIVRKVNIMTRMNWSNTQYFQWLKKEKIDKIKNLCSSKFIDEDLEIFKKVYFNKIRDPRTLKSNNAKKDIINF